LQPDLQSAQGMLWGRGGGGEPLFEATTFMSAVQRHLRAADRR
jgi:hypothetical protein